DGRTDIDEPQVTLRVGGTVPQGSPCIFNVPGQVNAQIDVGNMVVYDVPDLRDPIQFGNSASGRPINKVTLVARAADKTSTARRIQNVLGSIVHDPAKFERAMVDHAAAATAMTRAALSIVNSYKTSLLMGLDLLLKNDIVRVSPSARELLDNGGAQLDSDETVARLGELIGVLDKRAVYASLGAAERAKYANLEFDLKQRFLPV